MSRCRCRSRADLGFDVDALVDAVTPRTKLVFLASPNNPTGMASTTKELTTIVEGVPESVIVVIDEAYREFLDPGFGDPVAELVPRFRNVVVTRTFSKAHGLAGLRVGYAIGDPDVIATIDKTLLPFSVNSLAQAAALAAIEHEATIRERVAAILAERARVEVELAAAGWTFPNHQGNFVWLATGDRTDDIALGTGTARRGGQAVLRRGHPRHHRHRRRERSLPRRAGGGRRRVPTSVIGDASTDDTCDRSTR